MSVRSSLPATLFTLVRARLASLAQAEAPVTEIGSPGAAMAAPEPAATAVLLASLGLGPVGAVSRLRRA